MPSRTLLTSRNLPLTHCYNRTISVLINSCRSCPGIVPNERIRNIGISGEDHTHRARPFLHGQDSRDPRGQGKRWSRSHHGLDGAGEAERHHHPVSWDYNINIPVCCSVLSRPCGLHHRGGASPACFEQGDPGPMCGWRGPVADPDREQTDETLQRSLPHLHQQAGPHGSQPQPRPAGHEDQAEP
ncbi:unnamed protein product [Oncorhynchus mykiss]|uniref:Uncharacterized protein n=1 Tax=Oncorhynchus mykiss TaxID=8022 RepID=A0A060X7C8_ONCMY|nr:unnamed protein product [Oncorhynchus mykiss]